MTCQNAFCQVERAYKDDVGYLNLGLHYHYTKNGAKPGFIGMRIRCSATADGLHNALCIGAETGGGWGGSIPLTFFAMTEKLSPHFRRYVGLLLFSLIIRPFQLTPCSTALRGYTGSHNDVRVYVMT